MHSSHIYIEHNFYSSVLFYSDDFRTIWSQFVSNRIHVRACIQMSTKLIRI